MKSEIRFSLLTVVVLSFFLSLQIEFASAAERLSPAELERIEKLAESVTINRDKFDGWLGSEFLRGPQSLL